MRILVFSRACHHDAVPAFSLGAIKRRINHQQNLIGGFVRPIRYRNCPETHRDPQWSSDRLDRLLSNRGSELFGLRAGLGRRLKDAPGFYALLVAAAVAALSLEVFGVPPVRALYYASIANGVAAPGLLLLVLWLARSRRVLGGARIGRTGAALIALGALAGVALPVAYFALPT